MKFFYTNPKWDSLIVAQREVIMRGDFFRTNTVWYILLGIITVAEIIYFMVKTKNRKHTMAVFLTMTGLADILEVTIYAIFRSYIYFPMIIHNSTYPDIRIDKFLTAMDDGILGCLFSEFSLGATAAIIAALDLKPYWCFIFAGIYGLIEELFIYLGIYKHNWYQTWMTVVGLLIFFTIAKIIYKKAQQGMGGIWRYLTVLFGVSALSIPLINAPFRLSTIYWTNPYLLSDPLVSSSIIYASEAISLTNIILCAYFLKLKWYWHGLIILSLATVYYVAWKFQILLVRESCIFAYIAVNIFGIYAFVFLIDWLYRQGKKEG